MAKGVEDTAFYRYHRLISLNDVGGDLHRFGITTAEFHVANQDRLRDWPLTMLATSTHDSKRSEDVRARINILSEIPALWRLRVRNWRRFNRNYRSLIEGKPAPSPNDEYALYQTLLGAWPSPPLGDANDRKAFSERIQSYMLKAIRESKQNTSWINQNSAYESAVSSFVNALLTPGAKNRFLNDFIPFQRQLARVGLWNSLSQTLLKLTSPGVPDIYQGNDLWDFSLVDPDNRRPIDYAHRQQLFESIRRWGSTPDATSVRRLLESPEDGQPKLYLIWKTLCLRKQWPDVFHRGKYLPLTVEGERANHVVAFLQKNDHVSLLVVVPRLVAGLLGDSDLPPMGSSIWKDTQVSLPFPGAFETYQNAFTGAVTPLPSADTKIAVSDLLADFPVALCMLGEPPARQDP
jgi:(1->4)-alpha-D-glucan 1-alpha-D-glucosylmutase